MANMASYFSHDSNARNDEKILQIRMRHGAAGYGVYFMLIERLRDSSEYMSVKDYNMLAFDLRVDAKLIKSVVEDFGLFAFTEDGECFYSESLMRRMELKDEVVKARSEAGRKGAASRWNTQKTGENMANAIKNNGKRMANTSQMPSKNIASKESKVKKGKIDIYSTEPVPASAPQPEKAKEKSMIELPLNNGSMWPVTQTQYKEWCSLFPAVDTLQELKKMFAWLDANKQRRKTARGIKAFCVRWLSSAQDNAGKYRGGAGQYKTSQRRGPMGNFEQREYTKEDIESLFLFANIPSEDTEKNETKEDTEKNETNS